VMSPHHADICGSPRKQDHWRWCHKCQTMWFNGNKPGGVCAAGGMHDESGSGHYELSLSSHGPCKTQDKWRWCNKCMCIMYSGLNRGVCPAGGTHDNGGSGEYHMCLGGLHGQKEWRWCCKCQVLFYGPEKGKSHCPANGGRHHDDSGSGSYQVGHVEKKHVESPKPFVVVAQAPVVSVAGHRCGSNRSQDRWRWCRKCQCMWYNGAGKPVCAAGGHHDEGGSGKYHLGLQAHGPCRTQDKWKWCHKCSCIMYTGLGKGHCPAGGHHDNAGSGDYHMCLAGVHGQKDWKWCNLCQVLFYGPEKGKSHCAAHKGRPHDDGGSGSYQVGHD